MEAGGRRNTIYFTATFLALFIITSSLLSNAEDFDYPSIVKPPVSWTNLAPSNFSFWESAGVRPMLLSGTFVCGFHCKFEGAACVFAISIFQSTSADKSSFSPQMVWSANRNKPVRRGAKLQLSQEGDLALQDVDSTLVWSTETSGKSVTGLKLTHQGNLMLIDRNNETVWQSFDHPTDCLVLGQSLVSGQKLMANMSDTNSSEGLYSFSIDNNGYFVASAELDANLVYYHSHGSPLKGKTGQFYVELTNTSYGSDLSPGSGLGFIQLGSNGHLRSFRRVESEWKDVDLFENHVPQCDYPLACGKYGICSAGGCSCPEPDENRTTYFKQTNPNQPDLGCSPYVPISCESRLLQIKNVSCSPPLPPSNSQITDIESCKQACLNNCSCEFAAFKLKGFNSSSGWCSFGYEASFKREVDTYYNPSVFLKVPSSSTEHIPQNDLPSPRKRIRTLGVILGSTLGATLVCFVSALSFYCKLKRIQRMLRRIIWATSQERPRDSLMKS